MNELQEWRDWAANILGVYVGIDPALVADIKIGNGDTWRRGHICPTYAGAGLGQMVRDRLESEKKAGDA